MKHPNEIAREEAAMGTLVELTSVFEGIASMKISRIKNQVMHSMKFFDEIWGIYAQLRVDSLFSFGREENATKENIIDKELWVRSTAIPFVMRKSERTFKQKATPPGSK